MIRTRTLLTAVLLSVPVSTAMAQGTADKPISAVPGSGLTTAQPSKPPSSRPSTSTIKPGKDYDAGTANVGNSSESNGVTGSQGAGASATMQSGHLTNR